MDHGTVMYCDCCMPEILQKVSLAASNWQFKTFCVERHAEILI